MAPSKLTPIQLRELREAIEQALKIMPDAAVASEEDAKKEAALRAKSDRLAAEERATAAALEQLRDKLDRTTHRLNNLINARIKTASGATYQDLERMRRALQSMHNNYAAAFGTEVFRQQLDAMSPEDIVTCIYSTLERAYPDLLREPTTTDAERYDAAVDAQLTEAAIAAWRTRRAQQIVAAGKARRSEKLTNVENLLLADLRKEDPNGT